MLFEWESCFLLTVLGWLAPTVDVTFCLVHVFICPMSPMLLLLLYVHCSAFQCNMRDYVLF